MERANYSRYVYQNNQKMEQCLTKKYEQYIQDCKSGLTFYYRSA